MLADRLGRIVSAVGAPGRACAAKACPALAATRSRSRTSANVRCLQLLLLGSMLLSWMLPVGGVAAAPPFGDPVTRTGRLTVNWGDGRTGWSSVILTLSAEGEEDVQVLIDEPLARRNGGLMGLNRANVTVRGHWAAADGVGHPAIRAEAIDPAGPPASSFGAATPDPAALSGSQPWINVLCKFADVPSEPKPLAYFDGLIGDANPGWGITGVRSPTMRSTSWAAGPPVGTCSPKCGPTT